MYYMMTSDRLYFNCSHILTYFKKKIKLLLKLMKINNASMKD
jgi:hypothetical protein